MMARRPAQAIVFIGDSITQGWPAGDPRLFRPGWINAGLGGDTTGGMRARFARDVVDAGAQAVHIMGGTNDLWHGVPGPDACDAIANLAAMIEHGLAHDIAIVLALPPPIAPAALPLFRHPEFFAMLTHRIELLAHQTGVTLVDYAPSLCDPHGRLRGINTTDGVHLTPRGYRAMRHAAARALGAALA